MGRSALSERPDAEAFVRERLRLGPLAAIPEITLYQAHAGSALGRDAAAEPPYWAFAWGGGLALARYLLDHPDEVAGKRVLDLGAGSGLVAIAAARVGAISVVASEIDPLGRAATALNAEANGVSVAILDGDLLDGPVPGVDVILVGDLFYEAALARRVTAFLDRCKATGISILVGDPGRTHLPLRRLRKLASYDIADFGSAPGSSDGAAVYAFT